MINLVKHGLYKIGEIKPMERLNILLPSPPYPPESYIYLQFLGELGEEVKIWNIEGDIVPKNPIITINPKKEEEGE